MPELPEVETIKNGLVPHINNTVITDIIIRQNKLRWPIPSNIKTILNNSKIIKIERRAKYLLFYTELNKSNNNIKNNILVIHLGMSGTLQLVDFNTKLKKHDHVDFILNNNKILRYNDPRRFGAIFTLNTTDTNNIDNHIRFKHLGPEPLTKYFNSKYIYNLAQNRKTPVKNFIMNNSIVVGVGNIYATEALFYAKIHPAKPINQISLKQWEVLVSEIKKILKKAIKSGGTTLKDFINLDGKPGYFKQELAVYGKDKQACTVCNSKLQSIKQQGRTTVYCNTCQI